MIRRFLSVVLGVLILSNITYGKSYHGDNRTNTTIDHSSEDLDEYYDDYDYDTSDGYRLELNQTFRYCFMFVISVSFALHSKSFF